MNFENTTKAIEITQNTLKHLYMDETPDTTGERKQAIDIYERYLKKLQARQKKGT